MNIDVPLSFQEHSTIKGMYVITPHVFYDYRGYYKKIYEYKPYAAHGILQEFTETSEIVSDKGVFRGLHYQTEDSQAKLVHVIQGKLFDVAIDLRADSKTFGQWAGYLLTGEKNEAVFIPEGFAHGFLVLADHTIFTYQCSGVYRPEFCGGIRWDDEELCINWPLNEIDKMILSEKDKHNISIAEYRERMGITLGTVE